MFTRALFFTLIYTIFALHAADDKIITLQSNDGACITISASVAKHSATLNNIIGDCPESSPVLTNFTEQELDLLADVLNTIHQATSEQDAIRSLRNMINSESEHSFATLHDFFDVYSLRPALAEHFFHAFGLNKAESLLKKAAAIAKICDILWINCTNDKIDAITREQREDTHRVIENMRLTDKEIFLSSKGKNVGLFFTGVSIGEAAEHGLINMNYRPVYINNECISTCDIIIDTLSDQHLDPSLRFDVHITGDNITSLDGFAPTAPIDITNKERTIWISRTNIWHLTANSFQYAQDPETLLMNHNKIASIGTNAFRGLLSLKSLHLSSNNITYLPPKVFEPLVNLQELGLSNNKLTHIHANMFKKCTKLKAMYLLDTLIPQQKINALRTALPHVIIYASFSPLVASNYSLINS